jgi:acetyl-CoA synthetase
MSNSAAMNRNIDNLLGVTEEYAAPEIVANTARQQNFKDEYARSIADTDAFWSDYARHFQWSREWDKVSEWDGVNHKWFIGGRTNITANALDRHADSERRNRAAFIWLGEDNSERIITYGQLHRTVCRFNGLKSIGVKKGDRVIIYMPLVIEGVVAICSRARGSARFIRWFTPDSARRTPRTHH